MPEKTFSQKLQRLEEIVTKLESPDIELEEGLKLLEEGVALHRDCQKVLTQSQAKITKLLDSSMSAEPESASTSKESETASLFETGEDVKADSENGKDSNDGLPF